MSVSVHGGAGATLNGVKRWFTQFHKSFFFKWMAKKQNSRFEIEKFNGKNNFEIWKVKMQDLLVQQGVAKALLGKAKNLIP